MGCGRLVKPVLRFDEDMDPTFTSRVVNLVRDMLRGKDSLTEACLRWQKKFEGLGDAEGVPVAVDALRRILAKILLDKPSGGNAGKPN